VGVLLLKFVNHQGWIDAMQPLLCTISSFKNTNVLHAKKPDFSTSKMICSLTTVTPDVFLTTMFNAQQSWSLHVY
jgi:hypothetical protein